VCAHLALLCGPEGKKLSKRDAGFSLHDVQNAGIIPEAPMHYLFTIGGVSVDHPMTLDDMTLSSQLHKTGHITYDFAALQAINRMYIHSLPASVLYTHIVAYERSTDAEPVGGDASLVAALQKEVNDIDELRDMMMRIMNEEDRDLHDVIELCETEERARDIITHCSTLFLQNASEQESLAALKKWAKDSGYGMKVVFCVVRYAVTGKITGIGMGALLAIMPNEEIGARLESLLR